MTSNTTPKPELSPLKRALIAIENLQAKVQELESERSEPIAIVGMGCRFPGNANNPDSFWELLKNGIDTSRSIPEDRWERDRRYTQNGHFLDRVDEFDAAFFDLSPREVTAMDPQQRLLLEVTWESLENAGIPASDLSGTATGVFVGINSADYSKLPGEEDNSNHLNAYSFTGNTASVAAGRLAHWFGFRGPAIAIDTACSSSLVALHLACQSLRSRDCQTAIAGGVNLTLSPDGYAILSQMQALAPDGRCKTFDASANGYGRGEGCGIVVLKRLSDAVTNRDNILAAIRGSAINNDGRSSGLTVPNGLAQQELLQTALARSRVESHRVSYVEVHGTGTSLGDPIEAEALTQIFAKGRDYPLILGSVKTNIGHLEAAAGIAGIVKVVLAMQHREIPPHLHLQQFNPALGWPNPSLQIPTKLTPWIVPEGETRIAGVSSFGMSGTNAHLILEEPPASPSPEAVESDRPLHLLTFSAKSRPALTELARQFSNAIASDSHRTLADICYSANTGRTHWRERGAIVARSTEELQQKLTEFASNNATDPTPPRKTIKTAFLFTGQGSQTLQMGRQLYETSPLVRQILHRCNEILRPYRDRPLLEVLYPDRGDSPLDRTAYTQPALFAIEYAIAQLWRSWGVEPDAVMGHSLGEYVAACVAGVFSLEAGLIFVCERARLMEQLPADGAMAVAFADPTVVGEIINSVSDTVAIAAFNSPRNVAISGPKTAVETVVEKLSHRGIDSVPLQVSRAFHSAAIDSILEEFRAVAVQVPYRQPTIPLISNLTGKILDTEACNADYWCDHLRQPVRFTDGVRSLLDWGCQAAIEVGPHPVLLGLAQQCVGDSETLWLPSLRRGKPDWSILLESLKILYLHGKTIDWKAFDGDYSRRRVSLPTYPFDRQRYWFATKPQKSPDNSLYIPQWKRLENRPPVSLSGHWLIGGVRQGLGQQLADRLTNLGATCEFINTSSPESAIASHPQANVVFIGELEEACNWNNCAQLFYLTKAIVSNSAFSGRLWVVTQAAQTVGTEPSSDAFAQNLLWGLGQVIALEHPQQWGGLIDIPLELSDGILDAIAAELGQIDADDRIVLRPDGRYGQRLQPWQPSNKEGAKALRPYSDSGEGVYLITGGFGGLGLQLARWLVDGGVRHLALLGRRPPSEAAEKTLQPLEAKGLRIDRFQADIAVEDDVAAVFSSLKAAGSPVKGVFHLAGVLDDGVLLQQRWDRFETVLKPKVLGAWNLHRHTESLPLDTFVTFSSIASLLGSPGQGNYAAANAFLDGLVRWRRDRGLPGLSVQWGPWAESGMAAKLDDRSQQRWKQAGVELLTPERGFALLGKMGHGVPPQVGVAPIDWSRFRGQHPHPQRYRLLDDLLPAEEVAVPANTWREGWDTLSPVQRRERILTAVQQELATVTGADPTRRPDPHTGFFELGLDSLMALELKNRLQNCFDLGLSATLTFDYPTIATLVDYLLSQLAPETDSPPDPEPAPSLSETEVLQLIDREFSTWVKQ